MDALPSEASVVPAEQKLRPPVVHDDAYRVRVERPCWFMQPPSEREAAAADGKERAVAQAQWLFHRHRLAEAARLAADLLAAGAVQGCKLTRTEVAELEDIRAHCPSVLSSK